MHQVVTVFSFAVVIGLACWGLHAWLGVWSYLIFAAAIFAVLHALAARVNVT
jgi:hypothetical protein